MSIIINNVSESYGVEYGRGEQHYELFINSMLKAKFTHNFKDELSGCLRKAADAFDKQEACGVDLHNEMIKEHFIKMWNDSK